jgi:uncharacterized protein YjbJ (UPF0337 family)
MPDVRKTITDAGYIAIGLGVMGFQQAQTRRRELQGRLESAADCFGDRVREARGRVEELAGELGDRVEPLKEQVEGRLGDLPDRVTKAVEPVTSRMREFVRSAA